MSDESETPTYLESNKPEAERCVELASAAWKSGDLAKAHRMLAKSLKLYPTQQANQLIQQLSQHVKEQQEQQQNNEQNRARQQREQQQRDQEEQARRQHQQRQQEHFRQQQQQRESSAYQRPNTTSQSTPSKPSPSPASASSPSPAGAAFTAEQRDSALLIIQKKSDYYAIFSVTKSATEQEIKKSYRKLALMFHPDKNKAPEAEEAFKVVNGAFQCLSDPQKRAHYDAYGVEDSSAGRGGGPARQQYYREDDLSPEDVFNMFFNGGMNSVPNMRRTYTYRRQQRQPQAQEDGPGALFGQFAHFLPLLLLLLFGLLSAPSGEEQVFGLEKSNQFPVWRSTAHAKVDYFVSHQFSYRYNRDIRALAAVEVQVEAQAFKKVEEECQRQKKAHAKDERKAKEDLKGADLAAKLNQLHAKNLPACDKFQTYQNNAHGAARGA